METDLVTGLVNPSVAPVTPETHTHSFINALVVSLQKYKGRLETNLKLMKL